MASRKKFPSEVMSRAFVLLKARGISNQAAADRANMTVDRIRQWQCRPLFGVSEFEKFLRANGLTLKVERLHEESQ